MSRISLDQEMRRGLLRFYIAPGLNIYLRMALFVALVTAGASLMMRFHWAVGAPVFIFGLVMAVAHGVDNTRRSPDTSEDRWVVGAAKDMRKIERKVEQAKRLPGSFMDGSTGWGFAVMLLFAIFCVILDFGLIPVYVFAGKMYTIIFIQLSLLITAFFTTIAMAWEPSNIISKKDLFFRERDKVLENWKSLKPVVRPMLLLDEGDQDMVTPEDIKLFVTFDGAPEDFIGVQAQITFNMNKPYLYCVVLAKKTFNPMNGYRPAPASDIVFEKGADGQIRYIVVRQYTTKNSGYSTSDKQADHVVDVAMTIVSDLLSMRTSS